MPKELVTQMVKVSNISYNCTALKFSGRALQKTFSLKVRYNFNIRIRRADRDKLSFSVQDQDLLLKEH